MYFRHNLLTSMNHFKKTGQGPTGFGPKFPVYFSKVLFQERIGGLDFLMQILMPRCSIGRFVDWKKIRGHFGSSAFNTNVLIMYVGDFAVANLESSPCIGYDMFWRFYTASCGAVWFVDEITAFFACCCGHSPWNANFCCPTCSSLSLFLGGRSNSVQKKSVKLKLDHLPKERCKKTLKKQMCLKTPSIKLFIFLFFFCFFFGSSCYIIVHPICPLLEGIKAVDIVTNLNCSECGGNCGNVIYDEGQK